MQNAILTLIIPGMTMIFASVFFALWWQEKRHRYILAYAYWFAAIALGIALQAWIIKDFGPLEVFVFHAISSSGLIVLIWGVGKRNAQRIPLIGCIALTTATGAVISFARAQEVQMVVLLAQNFNASLLFAVGAYGCWLKGSRSVADRVLLGAFTLLMAYSMFRPSITMVLASTMTMEEYQSSIMLTVNMAMTALLSLILSLALIGTIITDRLEETKVVAAQDALTRLPTRGAFELLARQMLARAGSENILVSLIVGDIDHFKRINDTFGHTAGDRVITRFGELIGERIRPGDVAGRIGGEEFCIVAWNCSEEGALALAERLRTGFERAEHSALPDGEMVTASFGVAQFRPGSDYTQTFKRADGALYRAKRGGRNRVASDTFDDCCDGPDFDKTGSAAAMANGAQIVCLSERQASRSS